MQCIWQTVACLQTFSVPLLRGTSYSEMLRKTGFPLPPAASYGTRLPNPHSQKWVQFPGIVLPIPGMHAPLTTLAACCCCAFPRWILIPGNCFLNPGNSNTFVACCWHSFPEKILIPGNLRQNPGNTCTTRRLSLHAGITHSRN